MSTYELQAELLRAEFPFLRPDHDPDIERYYELRSAGRPADALRLYRTRLQNRYPDTEFRTRVLRAFRTRDGIYSALLTQAYQNLGRRVLERVKRSIKYIALKTAAYDRRDAYATIKTAEAILAMLPDERFEAIAAIERLHRYAERLAYYAADLGTAADLVRAYLTETLTVLEEERRRRAAEGRQQAEDRRRLLIEKDKEDFVRQMERHRLPAIADPAAPPMRRAAAEQRTRPALLDLSSVRFSAADLSRIQIPPTLVSLEDKTLAFCFKYWNMVRDAAFERVLFLYSRKYGTKHHDVFMAIRRARAANLRDEELLAMVMAQLITGYYYSIRGDIYLQRNWALLKAQREHPAAPGAAAPGAVPPAPVAPTIRSPAAVRRTRPAKSKPVPVQARKPTVKAGQAPAKKSRKTPAVAAPKPRKAGMSVSDTLRRLSGRSYDVYRDLFFAKVRPAIRTVLGAGRGRFFSVPLEAEELVYGFLRDHYADPYMDWAESSAKAELSRQGYDLASLDPVIEECYRSMGK